MMKKDIITWVDDNIQYYDPDDCDYKLVANDAMYHMLHDFKVHFLGIHNYDTIDNENELMEYFECSWNEYYN